MNLLDDTVVAGHGVDVAIVGAGVIGLSIAYHLTQRGLSNVTVFERSGIAAEASGVQPGGVRQQWSTRINCLMARESVAFYREVADRLDAPTKPQLDLCGYLFLAHSEERLRQLADDVALQNSLGIPSRLLSSDDVAEVVPGIDGTQVLGASFCAEDGYVDQPQAVVEAFGAAATRGGATIERGDVVTLEPAEKGWRLRLRDGRSSLAEVVVVAAGYDTPSLLGPLGIAVPITKEARYLFLSDPIHERLLEPLVVSAERRFAAKQLANGRVLSSDLSAGSSPDRGTDDWRRHIKETASSLAPILDYVTYAAVVEGYYDLTPDHQPLLGPVGSHEGLWLAAGLSGHGFMMAPSVGSAVAAGIAGERNIQFLDAFSPHRFEHGDIVERELQIV